MRKIVVIAFLLAVLGCRPGTEPEFRKLVAKAANDLRTKTASHEAVWDLGNAERWALNQEDGRLIFTFPDEMVTCEAQIIGSFDKSKGTWLWSWDNPSVVTNLTRDSQKLREYGRQHGYEKLTQAEWKASENDGWEMAALATLLCEAQGAYRGPSGDTYVFITFGTPKITKR